MNPVSTTDERVLERGVTLADSMLWRLQGDYFEKTGARVWSANAVPSYVTSNPIIARSYARMFVAWLRDLVESGDPGFDPAQPVYLVEVASGSGRLAFHFLQSLCALLGDSPLAALDVRYVITDLSDHTLERLRRHPQLAPFVAAGRLDFARFDVERDQAIELEVSKQILAPGTIANPLGVIVNYLMCGLSSDVFRCERGALSRGVVTLLTRGGPDAGEPELLEQVDFELDHVPLEEAPYPEPAYNALLDHYRRALADTELVFPIGALRCLDRLRAIAGDRMLLVVGDRGDHLAEDLDGAAAPILARHGSVSLPVNLHALGEHARAAGGRFLSTPHRHASLAICAFLFGAGQRFAGTVGAYREHVIDGGPDDFFALKRALDDQLPALDVRALLAFLRMSSWDSTIFFTAMPALIERLPELTPAQRVEVRRAADAVWDRYFFLGEPRDVPYAIGLVQLACGAPGDAVHYLEASLHLHGRRAPTLHLLGECHADLGDHAAALRFADEALAADDGFDPARALRDRLVPRAAG